jgi:uncharacterized protein YndB with AHSA1/START domain
MKWVLIVVGSLAALVAVAFIVGSMLPRGHVVSRTLLLKQTPEAVWQVITDYEAIPSWHADIKSVVRMPDRNGRGVVKESFGGMEVTLEDEVVEPPRRLVRRIVDDSLPFGGRWTHEITPTAEGCALKITEDGFVNNPLFRLISRLMGQSGSINGVLTSLARKFGETPRIE